MPEPLQIWGFLVIGVEIVGIGVAAHALMNVRSDRGTIAWCVALVAMPFFALPLYALFGRSKFSRYREILSEAFDNQRRQTQSLADSVQPFEVDLSASPDSAEAMLAKLTPFAFSRGNALELLIDGERTFEAIFEAIRNAEEYVLLEFYTIRDDNLGNELRALLVERARAGVRVYVLYDQIGSSDLSSDFLESIHEAGVQTAAFSPPLRRCDFFHINFRNHRKIVVVDGRVAFVGGHNVGDEYLGRSEEFGAWRDTHVKVAGPAALDCQRIFLESWFWAARSIPKVCQTCALPNADGTSNVLVLPTGPVRGEDVCTLAFKALVHSARERCWIASPYFVPTDSMLDALRFAALRGVEVRILLPEKADIRLVDLASYAYLEELEAWNIEVYRYGEGFLHQKAILIDDTICGISTINFDQRSFHLNFEVGLFTIDQTFVSEVAEALECDFARSRLVAGSDYRQQKLPKRVAVQVARLFSPVL